MIVLQFLFLVSFKVLAWYSLKFVFRDEPKLRVMGFFGCTQKTVCNTQLILERFFTLLFYTPTAILANHLHWFDLICNHETSLICSPKVAMGEFVRVL